jgi:hypothetical protein
MAEQSFSWLTESTLETVSVLPQEEKKFSFANIKEKLLVHKTALIVVGALLVLLLILKFFQRDDVEPARMNAMAALMPIPKGQIVEGMLLRPVLIGPNTLSKDQRLIRLVQADAEKVMGKVRAKKDIPPHKPILWSDLELIPPTRMLPKVIMPIVTYPEK